MIFTDPPAIQQKDRNRIRKRSEWAETLPSPSRWRTSSQNRIYSSKLFDALRRVRLAESPAKLHGRSIREAADRALAVTDGGRMRWSSAILATRRSIPRKSRRFRAFGFGQRRARIVSGGSRGGGITAVERKVKFLGRLVPGCRKLALPSLFEEVSDYIVALEMQVRAMTTLTEKLTGFAAAPAVSRTESNSGSPSQT